MAAIKNKNYFYTLLLGLITLCSFSAIAEALMPPKYSVIDRNGVNVASNQLSLSLNDISIGGELGLSHTISSFGSNFVNLGGDFEGYRDNFSGGFLKVTHTNGKPGNPLFRLYVMRVFDIDSSTDFLINGDGTYTALSDQRYTFTAASNNTYLYIKPDGSEVTYAGYGSASEPRGYMSEVKYPNGFIIKVHKERASISAPIQSVTTNTGFQLKYIYDVHSRPLEASKRSATNNSMIFANSVDWSTRMPRYIKGVNNAIEYCAVNSSPCTLSENWPLVTYNWPDGMPRAMYIGDSEFSVVDAEGRKTIYYHRAIDEHVNGAGYPPGVSFIPRIIQVKDAASDQIVMNYEYVNITNGSQLGIGIGTLSIVESARLNRAWIGDAEWHYRAAASYDQSYNIANRSGGHQGIEVQINMDFIVPTKVTTQNQIVWLYPNYRNQMFQVEKIAGNNYRAFYSYDLRGNINKVEYHNDHSIEASYPASCSNRKTCNKATWISDGNGNKTYYTYHADSGQISTVTQPENERGITPQIRYTYAKMFAKYRINSSAVSTSPDGVWLLDKESYCADSNYSGGGCLGGDEIVTQYQYDAANLQLIGKAVTASGITLRTCYRYDIYGNQIGETKPNASLSSCAY